MKGKSIRLWMMRRKGIITFYHAIILLSLSACTTIDCPLNSIVQTAYLLQGDVETLLYILTVSTPRIDENDTVVLNQISAVDSFILPISYTHPVDTFYFDTQTTTGAQFLDTITITKEDHQHFQSVDCAASYFHTLTKVETTHHAIDSIAIHAHHVTNNIREAHVYLYFKSNL